MEFPGSFRASCVSPGPGQGRYHPRCRPGAAMPVSPPDDPPDERPGPQPPPPPRTPVCHRWGSPWGPRAALRPHNTLMFAAKCCTFSVTYTFRTFICCAATIAITPGDPQSESTVTWRQNGRRGKGGGGALGVAGSQQCPDARVRGTTPGGTPSKRKPLPVPSSSRGHCGPPTATGRAQPYHRCPLRDPNSVLCPPQKENQRP